MAVSCIVSGVDVEQYLYVMSWPEPELGLPPAPAPQRHPLHRVRSRDRRGDLGCPGNGEKILPLSLY